MGYDHINEYISSRVNDEEVRGLISDFAILWNQYERTIYEGEHHIRDIRKKIHQYPKIKDIENLDELYNRFLKYLEYRHISFSCDGLGEAYRIRIKDDNNLKGEIFRADLERILNGNDSYSKTYLLLLIAARVRNNMFHGMKGQWDLKEQKELFRICNEMLMAVLEITNLKDL